MYSAVSDGTISLPSQVAAVLLIATIHQFILSGRPEFIELDVPAGSLSCRKKNHNLRTRPQRAVLRPPHGVFDDDEGHSHVYMRTCRKIRRLDAIDNLSCSCICAAMIDKMTVAAITCGKCWKATSPTPLTWPTTWQGLPFHMKPMQSEEAVHYCIEQGRYYSSYRCQSSGPLFAEDIHHYLDETCVKQRNTYNGTS